MERLNQWNSRLIIIEMGSSGKCLHSLKCTATINARLVHHPSFQEICKWKEIFSRDSQRPFVVRVLLWLTDGLSQRRLTLFCIPSFILLAIRRNAGFAHLLNIQEGRKRLIYLLSWLYLLLFSVLMVLSTTNGQCGEKRRRIKIFFNISSPHYLNLLPTLSNKDSLGLKLDF